MQRWLIVALAATTIMAIGSARAEIGVEVEADVVSMYNWRGFNFGDDDKFGETHIAPAIQPSVTISTPMGVSLNVWSSFTLTDRDIDIAGTTFDANNLWDEIDLSLDYSRTINDKLGISVGGIYYTFLNVDDSDIVEVFGGASYAAAPKLSLSAKLYYSAYMAASGANSYIYYQVDAEYQVKDALSAGVSVGGGNEAFESLHFASVNVAYSTMAGPLSIKPHVLVSLPFRDFTDHSVEFAAGVSLGWSK